MASSKYEEYAKEKEVCPNCENLVRPIIKGIAHDSENMEQSYTCPECKYEMWSDNSPDNWLPIASFAVLILIIILAAASR
jgi:uncharacterized protein with PIN domain